MEADTKRRQFHDSHKAYNDFATKVLDKIAASLVDPEQSESTLAVYRRQAGSLRAV